MKLVKKVVLFVITLLPLTSIVFATETLNKNDGKKVEEISTDKNHASGYWG